MWRHDDFFRKPLSGGNPYGEEARQDLAEIASAAKEFPELSFLIAAPLMHGAALYSLFTFLTLGARVVLTTRIRCGEGRRSDREGFGTGDLDRR